MATKTTELAGIEQLARMHVDFFNQRNLAEGAKHATLSRPYVPNKPGCPVYSRMQGGTTMRHPNYRCPKCSTDICDVGEMRAAGGFWSKIFDVQGSRFTAVTCSNCKYTEFYRAPTSMMGNIFDLFTH